MWFSALKFCRAGEAITKEQREKSVEYIAEQAEYAGGMENI